MKTTRKDANRGTRRKRRGTAAQFGEWFRALRISRGLRGSRLSISAGQSRSYVSALECGHANPKAETIASLSIAMKLTEAERAELMRRAFEARPRSLTSCELASLVADCPTCSQRVVDALRSIKRTKKDCPPATLDAPACVPCEAVK